MTKKQTQSETMDNGEQSSNTLITRSGRKIKKPVRYEPVEKVTDDFSGCDSDIFSSEDGYDSLSEEITRKPEPCEDSVSGGETLGSDSSDESEDESASDADDQGNLKDFVVYSDSDDEKDENE